MLGSTDLLDRKPGSSRAASASGLRWGARSCASRPAFLMDEPLSNLDAKLRVEMRGEIIRVQRRIAAPTLYVTHDQTEAMTMGDRVADPARRRAAAARHPGRGLRQPGEHVRGRLHRIAGDEPDPGDAVVRGRGHLGRLRHDPAGVPARALERGRGWPSSPAGRSRSACDPRTSHRLSAATASPTSPSTGSSRSARSSSSTSTRGVDGAADRAARATGDASRPGLATQLAIATSRSAVLLRRGYSGEVDLRGATARLVVRQRSEARPVPGTVVSS